MLNHQEAIILYLIPLPPYKKCYELNMELETISNLVYSIPTIIYLDEPSYLKKTSNLILSLKSLLEDIRNEKVAVKFESKSGFDVEKNLEKITSILSVMESTITDIENEKYPKSE